jgi:predicted DNA-binding transcriptional regulator YafY
MATSRAAEESRERLVALVLLLQSATRQAPLTQETIVRELLVDDDPSAKRVRKVPAYQGSDAAVRQKFERDKAKIRDLGFQIETTDLGDGAVGYWIDPDSATAPRIDFTEDEERVVRLALRFCGFGSAGAFSLFNEGPGGDGGLEFTNYYTPLLRALNLRRVVRFDYRSSSEKTREVEPLAIGVFEGAAYLVGRVHGASEIKGYRIMRMTSMPIVLDERFDADEGARELARAWRPEYAKVIAPTKVVVTTSENYAQLLTRQFPEVTREDHDGGVEVSITFESERDAMRFLLDAADRVRLRSPKSLRREYAAWLSRVNRGSVPDLSGLSFAPSTSNDSLGQTLQLLHAVYLSGEGLRISDLSHRFSLAPAMVRRIMDRLVTFEPMAGAYGFPAHLVKDCDDWDDEANDDSLYVVEHFDRGGVHDLAPLFWRDLFEVNIALREAARLYPEPAIESAIAKIESAVDGFVRVETATNETLLAELRSVIDAHEQIKIEYTASGAETSTRVIEPRDVRVLNGHSYVRAYCTTREGWRTFRVDRIGAILAKSPVTEQRPGDDVANWLTQVGEVGDEVVVVLEAGLRWLFEPLPSAQWRALDDGRLAVAFRVSDPSFLDHLMLRAGPGAVVATGTYAKAGRALASRIAERL